MGPETRVDSPVSPWLRVAIDRGWKILGWRQRCSEPEGGSPPLGKITMVTFITLFLALVTGIQPVEVAVDGPVARIELLLDQRSVGVLERPPWGMKCDFGPSVAPHELEVVAYAADGSELDRDRQVVNLPRPPAEVRIAFVTGEQHAPRALRVFWESSENVEPLSLFVMFDGRVLVRDGEGLYPLPEVDPNEPHIVSAEATFLDDVTARSDVTFGGRYGSKVATEITAVPILVAEAPPSAEDLNGVFEARGAALRVVAIEHPRAQLFMVRDFATMARLAGHRRRQGRMGLYADQRWGNRTDDEVRPEEDRLHLVVPNARFHRNRVLFPTSNPISLERWRLPWIATHLSGDEAAMTGQQLLDAVAVAGLRAAADGTPRAVLLIVSDDPHDVSRFSVDDIRQYLGALRVPFHVWSVDGAPPGYGETEDITSNRGLTRAAKRLLDELDSQRIVWVEGLHMINQIELARPLPGIALAR